MFLSLSISIIQHLTQIFTMLFLLNKPFRKLLCMPSLIYFAITQILLLYTQTHNVSHVSLALTLVLVMYTLLIKGISKATLRNCAISVFLACIIQVITQCIPIFIIYFLYPNKDIINANIYSFIIICVSAILTYLMLYFLPIRKIYCIFENIPVFIIYTPFFLLSFYSILLVLFNEIPFSPLFTCVVLCCFFTITFGVIIYTAYQQQNKKQALQHYQTYLPILEDMITQVRKIQHNHNNTIQTISHLSKLHTDYVSLCNALEPYSQHLQDEVIPTKFLQLENKLLASLLYCKYCFAKEHNINFNVTIFQTSFQSAANEFELVDIAGILLDNAIEASETGETVYVEIGALDNINDLKKNNTNFPFTLTVKNNGPEASEDFIHKIFSKKYTTKTDTQMHHGLGLYSVRQTINRYKGQIIVHNELIANSHGNMQQYLVMKIKL